MSEELAAFGDRPERSSRPMSRFSSWGGDAALGVATPEPDPAAGFPGATGKIDISGPAPTIGENANATARKKIPATSETCAVCRLDFFSGVILSRLLFIHRLPSKFLSRSYGSAAKIRGEHSVFFFSLFFWCLLTVDDHRGLAVPLTVSTESAWYESPT